MEKIVMGPRTMCRAGRGVKPEVWSKLLSHGQD